MLDYDKIDPALAAALEETDQGPKLDVSVRTAAPLDPGQQVALERLGVEGLCAGPTVFTAKVTPQELESLTERPEVRLVSLARPLRPLS